MPLGLARLSAGGGGIGGYGTSSGSGRSSKPKPRFSMNKHYAELATQLGGMDMFSKAHVKEKMSLARGPGRNAVDAQTSDGHDKGQKPRSDAAGAGRGKEGPVTDNDWDPTHASARVMPDQGMKGAGEESRTSREAWQTETASRLGSRFRYDPDRPTRPSESHEMALRSSTTKGDTGQSLNNRVPSRDSSYPGPGRAGRSAIEDREMVADMVQTASLPSAKNSQKLPSWLDTVIFPPPPPLAPPAPQNQHSSSDEAVITPERHLYHTGPERQSDRSPYDLPDDYSFAASHHRRGQAGSHQHNPQPYTSYTKQHDRYDPDPFQAPLMSTYAPEERYYDDEPFASQDIPPEPKHFEAAGTPRFRTISATPGLSHAQPALTGRREPRYEGEADSLQHIDSFLGTMHRQSHGYPPTSLGRLHAMDQYINPPQGAIRASDSLRYPHTTPYTPHLGPSHVVEPYQQVQRLPRFVEPHALAPHSHRYQGQHAVQLPYSSYQGMEPSMSGWYYFGDRPPTSPPPLIQRPHFSRDRVDPRYQLPNAVAAGHASAPHMSYSSSAHGDLSAVDPSVGLHADGRPYGPYAQYARHPGTQVAHPAASAGQDAPTRSDIPASLTAAHTQITAARDSAAQTRTGIMQDTSDGADLLSEAEQASAGSGLDYVGDDGAEGENEAAEDWDAFVKRKTDQVIQYSQGRKGQSTGSRLGGQGAGNAAMEGGMPSGSAKGARGLASQLKHLAPKSSSRKGAVNKQPTRPQGGTPRKRGTTAGNVAADVEGSHSHGSSSGRQSDVAQTPQSRAPDRTVPKGASQYNASPPSGSSTQRTQPAANASKEHEKRKQPAEDVYDDHFPGTQVKRRGRIDLEQTSSESTPATAKMKRRTPQRQAVIPQLQMQPSTSNVGNASASIRSLPAAQTATNNATRQTADQPITGTHPPSTSNDTTGPITPIRSALKQPSSSQERARKRARRTRFDLPDLSDTEAPDPGRGAVQGESDESDEEEPAYTPSKQSRSITRPRQQPAGRTPRGPAIARGRAASASGGRVTQSGQPSSRPTPRGSAAVGGRRQGKDGSAQSQPYRARYDAGNGMDEADLGHLGESEGPKADAVPAGTTNASAAVPRPSTQLPGVLRQGTASQGLDQDLHDEEGSIDEDEDYRSDNSESSSPASSPPAGAYIKLTDGAQVGYTLPRGTIPVLPFQPVKPRRQPGLVPRSHQTLDTRAQQGVAASQHGHTSSPHRPTGQDEIPFLPIDQRPRNALGQFLPYATTSSPIDKDDYSDDDEICEEIDEFPSQSQTLSNGSTPSPPPGGAGSWAIDRSSAGLNAQGFASGPQQARNDMRDEEEWRSLSHTQGRNRGSTFGNGRRGLEGQMLSPVREEDENQDQGEEEDEDDWDAEYDGQGGPAVDGGDYDLEGAVAEEVEDEADMMIAATQGYRASGQDPQEYDPIRTTSNGRSAHTPSRQSNKSRSPHSSSSSRSSSKTRSPGQPPPSHKQGARPHPTTNLSRLSTHQQDQTQQISDGIDAEDEAEADFGDAASNSSSHKIDDISRKSSTTSNTSNISDTNSTSRADEPRAGKGFGEGFFGQADGNGFSIWKDHY